MSTFLVVAALALYGALFALGVVGAHALSGSWALTASAVAAVAILAALRQRAGLVPGLRALTAPLDLALALPSAFLVLGGIAHGAGLLRGQPLALDDAALLLGYLVSLAALTAGQAVVRVTRVPLAAYRDELLALRARLDALEGADAPPALADAPGADEDSGPGIVGFDGVADPFPSSARETA